MSDWEPRNEALTAYACDLSARGPREELGRSACCMQVGAPNTKVNAHVQRLNDVRTMMNKISANQIESNESKFHGWKRLAKGNH